MLKESVARRYSAALFALAQEAGAVEKTVGEIDAFVDVLSKDADLHELFVSPVVPRDVKQRIIAEALDGRVSETVLQFLLLLIRKRRENLIEVVARQLHELYDAEAGRQAALIETPRPLSAKELAELARRLSKVYRRTLIPEQKVVPDLLGGVAVQVGDKFVDATVAGRLEEMRRHLLATEESWRAGGANGAIT